MPRWKQRFVCLACAHSAWREVETEVFSPRPDPRALEASGFYCSACGERRYRVFQVELLAGRWADAFQTGGMRMGPIRFLDAAQRDLELQQARQARGKVVRR